MKKFDVIVIGSGGGAKIASSAIALGYKVAMIEEGPMGGTCLNRGCIPSKMMIYPAHVASLIRDSEKFDFKTEKDFPINFAKIVKRISSKVDDDSESIRKSYASNKDVSFFQGHAKFIENKVIEVNNEKIIGEKIFIAVGASPSIPPIPGLKDTPFMTSTEALRNTKLPKKLIVIGGGYIACELGYAYSALGSSVEFVVRSNLLNNEDSEVSKEFTNVFSKNHKVHLKTDTKEVSYKNKEFSVRISHDGKESIIKADALLVATGVRPNTFSLGLENTNIKLDDKGFIKVDKFLETSVPGVFALGDVIGKYLFRHSVNFESSHLVDSLFINEEKSAIKYPPMPHAVFTHPEIAGVGKTEDELKNDGIEYVSGVNPYSRSAMGSARLSDHGFVKLLFDKKSKKLIGAHIIGDEASTMIHQLIIAMTLNATLDDLLKMIYIHPALPEIVRNAARKANIVFEEE